MIRLVLELQAVELDALRIGMPMELVSETLVGADGMETGDDPVTFAFTPRALTPRKGADA